MPPFCTSRKLYDEGEEYSKVHAATAVLKLDVCATGTEFLLCSTGIKFVPFPTRHCVTVLSSITVTGVGLLLASCVVLETKSLAVAKKPCDCCMILKLGSYTKAI